MRYHTKFQFRYQNLNDAVYKFRRSFYPQARLIFVLTTGLVPHRTESLIHHNYHF